MRKRDGILPLLALMAVVLLSAGCGRGNDAGIPVSFNDGWMFIRQDSANLDKILPGNIPNNKWEEVTLPHSAVIEPLVISEKQWTGICWYRKLYRADRRQRHKNTGLLFDGAMHDAIIYLNGAEIARHTGGYLPFYVNLTDDLVYGRENEILVRLDNRENPSIPPGKPLDELDFLWYSGLYRNVSLYVTDKLHITTSPGAHTILGGGIITGARDISREAATLTASVHVSNDDRIPRSFHMRNTLLDAAGLDVASSRSERVELEPGQSQRLMTKIIVMQPSLWSPDKPFLYTLVTELRSDNGVIDRRETRTGIRSVRITPDKGLVLNGEPVQVTGTNRHQEYPYIGYALSDEASYRDAFKIMEAGFNLVRCSHYPPSPAFLDACDELGLMVIDAIPGWQFFGDSLFSEASVSNTRQMCRRDRNHPSVIMWEASLNETVMPVSFLSLLHETVREELPYGNNYTCSWMDTICDVFIPARQHATAPEYWKKYGMRKPVFISEYGDWEYYAQNAGFKQAEFSDLEPSVRNSRQLRGAGERRQLQQAHNFQEAHNDNLYGPCFGDANWLMYDYNRGYAPDIEASGIMDIFRLPKFAYWFYLSQAEVGPVCFIAHYNLPLSGNTVRVFSNADTIRLFRNDTLIAAHGPDTDPAAVNLKHPPFTFTLPGYYPGTLKAEGLRKGAAFAQHSVTTPGQPAALRLTADFSNKPLQAGGSDVVFVYATMVDSTGIPVHNADSLVEFSVRGNADLIGANPVRAEAGVASILLRAGANPGKIMIRAVSGKMAEAEIMTETRERP
jgi:beta-galactosidase